MTDKQQLASLRKRLNRARNFPQNTCGASRHVALLAAELVNGRSHMLTEEPEHCAISMLSVVASLWEARTELLKRAG